MKKIILASLIIIVVGGTIQANPLPWARIEYVSAFPPEIGLMCYDSLDLNGDTISTVSGTAIITNFVFPGHFQMFVFDSSNTTGFTIGPEGDEISILDYYIEYVSFGRYGYPPHPIAAHAIRFYDDYWHWGYTYDFTSPEYGETEIVINEVSAHSDWAPESNFIELYNQSDSAFDIGGWMIVCDAVTCIPPGTIIDGHKIYVIDETNFAAGFDLDSDSDNIYLIRNDSAVVDQVGWSTDHGANVSFMRYPDGEIDTTLWPGYTGYNDITSCTFENGFPSRGAPNRHDSPGFVVIGTHASGDTGVVEIGWTDPIWDPLFDYSVVVRNFNHYPQDPSDGIIAYQGTEQQAVDIGLPGNAVIHYTIFARDINGNYSVPTDESRVLVTMGIVGIDEEASLPQNISSLECYPNPFNAAITIDFILDQAGPVSLLIYNIQGQKIADLIDNSIPVGEHRITWDGSDYPSGIYFARLQTGEMSKSVKMVLLK